MFADKLANKMGVTVVEVIPEDTIQESIEKDCMAGDKVAGDMGKERAFLESVAKVAKDIYGDDSLKNAFMGALKDPGILLSTPNVAIRAIAYTLNNKQDALDEQEKFSAKGDWKYPGMSDDNDD